MTIDHVQLTIAEILKKLRNGIISSVNVLL